LAPDCPITKSVGCVTAEIRKDPINVTSSNDVQKVTVSNHSPLQATSSSLLPALIRDDNQTKIPPPLPAASSSLTNDSIVNVVQDNPITKVNDSQVASQSQAKAQEPTANITTQQPTTATTSKGTTVSVIQVTTSLSEKDFEEAIQRTVEEHEKELKPQDWLDKIFQDFDKELPSHSPPFPGDTSSFDYPHPNQLLTIRHTTTPMSILLISIVVIGVLMCVILITVAAKYLYEFWVRRKYQKLSAMVDT